MGPYCKFCNSRCFVAVLESDPPEIRARMGQFTMLATCPRGVQFDSDKLGVSWIELRAAKEAKNG